MSCSASSRRTAAPTPSALLEGLESVPRRRIEYRGLTIEEMDLDAVLARHPQLAVVDEIAHTNAPGSRNKKRYQDVFELLDAGINVICAFNVQHLESLKDIVERATGVAIRETVPDSFLKQADQVVNLDLDAEDLLERLRAGKIYAPEKVEWALTHFFKEDKLSSLRELALREVAERLDSQATAVGRNGREAPAASTTGRVMVCMASASPRAASLLRRGSRLAGRLNTDWFVVYVETPGEGADAHRGRRAALSDRQHRARPRAGRAGAPPAGEGPGACAARLRPQPWRHAYPGRPVAPVMVAAAARAHVRAPHAARSRRHRSAHRLARRRGDSRMTFRIKVLLAQAPLGVALALLAVLAVRTIGSLGTGAEAILEGELPQRPRRAAHAERARSARPRGAHPSRAATAGSTPLRPTGRSTNSAPSSRSRKATSPRTERDRQPPSCTGAGTCTVSISGCCAGLTRPPPLRRYFRDLAPDFLAVRQATDRILDLNQDAMLRKSDRAREQAARMGTVMIAASLGALLLGIILSSLLTNRLVQPVARLREAAHRIGAGDFSARVPVAGRDELAQLATTFNGMADRLDRYRRSSLGELLLAQQAAQSAIDSLPDPVVVFDANGGVLIVNRAGEGLLGIDLGPARAPRWRASTRRCARVVEQARDHVLGGKGAYVPRGFEDAARVPSSSNGDEYYLARATPVYGEQGGITGATVILQDVTRLHRFDQLKNDLVATVAHEFRTPLTSLRMAIHLCLEQLGGPLSEKQADLLYGAREDCERLQRIVDELLDLAKIQGGRMQLQRRRLAPRALVDAAVDAQHSLAAERHVELHSEVAPGLPELDVDADRIQLVFANLLTNAIRHSPDGAEVALRSLTSDGAVRFEVADQGPGIPEAQREVIFEKFAQGADAPGGAGLGLSIAKEIVTAHGGQIGVDSEVGRGSTFWFIVPVRQ